MWTIGLGFVSFNIVLVILLNIVSNYIYDRVPIKAAVSVSIAVTGTLGIIWGIWVGKVSILLGINLIVALAIWIFLSSHKCRISTTIPIIIMVTAITRMIWGLTVGTVSILVGIISSLLMVSILWIILIVLSWILIPRIVEIISGTTKVISGIDAAIRAIVESLAKTSELNHITHTKIINLIDKVVQSQQEERSNISGLIETMSLGQN
jgi:hypothetical protein